MKAKGMGKSPENWEPVWTPFVVGACEGRGWQKLSLEDFSVSERLSDTPRPGRPPQITAEQFCQLIAFACEQPKERPITHWTGREIAKASHAAWDSQVHFSTTRIAPFKKGDLQPHLIRYWLTPPADPKREETIRAICTVYHDAPSLAKQGERTVSTDELTGVQALERKYPGLPLVPDHVQRREFEYKRHGTRSFILSRDVVTGKLLAPFCGPTRTEEDFLAHVQAVIATDQEVTRWHVVCDTLNIHQSEALVRWVADLEGIEQETLGKKGDYGILALMPRRAAFLSDPSHQVVFHYTPNHSSWLNQIEIWLSILMRKVLKRGSFSSVQDLEARVLADHLTITMRRWPGPSSGPLKARH
jgi:transposase